MSLPPVATSLPDCYRDYDFVLCDTLPNLEDLGTYCRAKQPPRLPCHVAPGRTVGTGAHSQCYLSSIGRVSNYHGVARELALVAAGAP
jgi:hypothetical protein